MAKRKRKQWLDEHRRDPYVRQAAHQGMRSRAVYKLREIDRRDRLLRRGMTVVDLGAAPGSWSQYIAQRVGKEGTVIACDLLPIEPLANVTLLQGDIRDPALVSQLRRLLPGGIADLVISDMAPKMTGISITDQARSLELVEAAIALTTTILRRGGTLVVKVFQGIELATLRSSLQSHFRQCLVRKPDASRARSREIYLLARGFRAV